MKKIMIEPSNSIKNVKGRLEEKKISDLEDRSRKKKKKNVGILWNLCTFFFEVLNINGVPEGREKEKSRKLI